MDPSSFEEHRNCFEDAFSLNDVSHNSDQMKWLDVAFLWGEFLYNERHTTWLRSPLFKALFSSKSPEAYDSNNYLFKYNRLVIEFNRHLRQNLVTLNSEYPDAIFIYADAYTPSVA